VVVLPKGLDPKLGVLNANLNTALNGILDAHPSLGDVVVVSGLGVIGLLATQLARRAGAGMVIGVDVQEFRRQLAKRFGADAVLSPRDGVAERVRAITETRGADVQEFRRELAKRFGADAVLSPRDGVAERVRAMTENRGADIAIEVSGAPPALNEAIRTVGFAGRVIAVSWYGGTFESLNLMGEFHHNRPRVYSSQVGSMNPDLGPLWDVARRQDVVSRLFGRLDLAPMFTHEFPVGRAAEAYATVDEAPDGLVQCFFTYGD